jgi:hypothetical protein
MSRRRQPFTPREVTGYAKAVLAAGLSPSRLQIDPYSERIILDFSPNGGAGASNAPADEPNDFDTKPPRKQKR